MTQMVVNCTGQVNKGNKSGSEAAQKSLDRRAAHNILRGARELLTSRAVELKAQAAQMKQVMCKDKWRKDYTF